MQGECSTVTPLRPFSFAGDVPTSATLLGPAIEDVNLMTCRVACNNVEVQVVRSAGLVPIMRENSEGTSLRRLTFLYGLHGAFKYSVSSPISDSVGVVTSGELLHLDVAAQCSTAVHSLELDGHGEDAGKALGLVMAFDVREQ